MSAIAKIGHDIGRTACAIAAAVLLSICMLVCGCSDGTGPSTKAKDFEAAVAAGDADYYMFTDSCGREVALPRDIQSVSPSGSYAKIYLASLAPEKLVSLPSNYSERQMKYMDPRLGSLPTTGSFYGKNADMNYEEIIRMSPDVVIDIGESKTDIAEDLDNLQEQSGIPVIFVEATLDHASEACRTLGALLGEQEKTEELAAYVDETLAFAAVHREEVAAASPRVLYTDGAYGYEVKGSDKLHGSVLEIVGVNNVADLEGLNSNTVSPEQVMVWDPEVVLLSRGSGFFDYIFDDSTWQSISAVKSGEVYEVPDEPYEWMDQPPSLQTVLGVKWLGNLLFPEIYDFDMVQETQRFYKLLWGYSLSEQEARDMLANSTFAR